MASTMAEYDSPGNFSTSVRLDYGLDYGDPGGRTIEKNATPQYVFCGYCQSALLPEHLRCQACGAPRPEYRPYERREWPEYERRAVALATTSVGLSEQWDTT